MTRYIVLIAMLISMQAHSDSADETFVQCGTDYFFKIDNNSSSFSSSRMYRITHKRETEIEGWFDRSTGTFFYSGHKSGGLLNWVGWGAPKNHKGVTLNKHPDKADSTAWELFPAEWSWGFT